MMIRFAKHSLVLTALLATSVSAGSVGQTRADLQSLLTRAERTNFEETSRYEDVMAFVTHVSRVSPRIHLTSFGYTQEGRAMPLLVVGNVDDANAATVRAAGLTRVFIQGNIHAGEVCGKEAVQMLLREIALGQHAHWLDSLVLLIAPIYNADGNERVQLTNRGRQHGPLAGMGQRPNAQGYDLNRDHMKLDSPEARALVRLMTEYDPHVGIDLHTNERNAARVSHHVLTSATPGTHEGIDDLLRNEWLPAAQAYLKDDKGWESYYYGNAGRQQGADQRGRYTFDHRPRFNNNYLGLRNRFAILSEAYSYATFEERVIATKSFVEGAVEFAFANGTRIRNAVEHADAISLVGQRLPVRAERMAGNQVDILMGDVDEVRNPYSGATILLRNDTRTVERMVDFGEFQASEWETVPSYYVVPEDLEVVIAKLRDHGVSMERVAADRRVDAQVFVIDSSRAAQREFQGHRERTVFGRYVAASRTVSAGSMLVRTNQPLGRLVFFLLEPRSDDGLVNWAFLDDAVDRGGDFPIFRVP